MTVELMDRTDMADCDTSKSGQDEPVSELDQLFQVMERMQIPEGFKSEIVEGTIHVSPQRATHWHLILAVIEQLRALYAREQLLSDVRIDFPGRLNGFSPDVAATREGAQPDDRGRWSNKDVEFVLEVISWGTQDNDYGKKKQAYALAGVGVYLIADPYTAQCHLHTRPEGDQFWSEQIFAFGERIDLKGAGIDLALETDDFPRD